MLRFLILERETGFPDITPYRASIGTGFSPVEFSTFFGTKKPQRFVEAFFFERETGFEPATFSLEG